MNEIIGLRSEYCKHFDLGNGKQRLISTCGTPVHYKDDYSNPAEEWKDIDTTIVNGRIDKAPYEAILDPSKKTVTVRSKKTNITITIKLDSIVDKSDKPLDLSTAKPLSINNKISWNGIVPDHNFSILFLPTFVVFNLEKPADSLITANLGIDNPKKIRVISRPMAKATPVITEFAGTEQVSNNVKVGSTVTIDVAANADDGYCQESVDTVTYNTTVDVIQANTASSARYHSGYRFQVNLAASVTLNQVNFKGYVYGTANDILDATIKFHDHDNSPNFITDTTLHARTQTDATGVSWDFSNVGAGYQTSPDIKVHLREVMDRAGWASGNYAMVIIKGDNASQSENTWFNDYLMGSNPPQLYIDYGTIKIMNETIGLSEGFARKYFKFMAESIGISDGSVGRFFSARIMNETIGLSESVGKVIIKVVNETVGITESLLYSLRRYNPDTISLVDSMIKRLTTFYHPVKNASFTSATQKVNRVFVLGLDDDGNVVFGGYQMAAADIKATGEALNIRVLTAIRTSASCQDVAQYIYDKMRFDVEQGILVAPPACHLEMFDVIRVTDRFADGISDKDYRIIGIETVYDTIKKEYLQTFRLGKV